MKGPITYAEFKKRYQDDSYDKLTYMSPFRDGMDMDYHEWKQIFKDDKIFKDLDPKRYNELKRGPPKKKKSKQSQNNNENDKPLENNKSNKQGLAKPMSIKEMREKEAK